MTEMLRNVLSFINEDSACDPYMVGTSWYGFYPSQRRGFRILSERQQLLHVFCVSV